MAGNPISGHTNHNLTVATATNVDGLGDGDHILSPTLTNMVEGIHGNGVIMYDDTSGGEGSRNKPHELPGAVNYASGTTFTVQGGYAVLDGIMYQFAGGVGDEQTYTLNTSSASAAGSPTALTSGKEALVVVYVSADNTSTVKNIYWELGTATTAGTNSYPATPTSFLNIPIATGTASENYLSNNQTVVLAVLRVAFASGGDDLKLVITEVNDKRVFIRPSPMYFSPVTSGDVASTDELLDLDAFHSGIGNGALGASRFGAMWQSFGAAVTGSTVPDDNKDVLYYSGTHAARFTRSVFDRVLTSADATITIKSTDANALILTPTASTNVITNGSFPAGYIIYIRNLDTDDYVRFALTSSASSTMASYYEIAPATFASFICTTSHASYPTFALLFDDTIDTPQIAADAVTLAKMASGTDGNIISYDASGNPVAVATGNDGQVLTSTGAGSPPAFETLPVIADEEVTLAMLAHAPANTVLVRDAADIGDPSFKEVTNTQILIGDGTGFTAAALSGDATMTNAGVVAIGNDKITADMIGDNVINSEHYAAASIDNEHLADNAVDSDEIAADAVITAKILNSNVTLAKLANIADDTMLGNISGSAAAPAAMSIANVHTLIGEATESITGLMSVAHHDKLDSIAQDANNYVHPNHSGDVTSTADGATVIGNNKVTTVKILNANVTTAKIADDAVTYAKMQNLGTADRVLGSTSAGVIGETQVVTDMIATDAVTNAKIADGAVDTEHIAADAIEEEHIGDGEVKTAAIANSNVTLAKIANIADDRVLGNISGSAAAPAELTAANLRTLLTVADGSLSQNNFTNADHSKLDGIAASANNYVHPNHSGEVTSNADGATTIANGAVVADRIAADAVITAKILNANVTTAKIAADAVTSAKIADDAVDTEHIADDAIEEEHIGDGEVKTAAIGDEQVTLAKMANMATSRVLGRISSNAGVPEVLTAANIRTILGVADGSLTTNDFTNADHSKLNGIEASATIDQTASEILTLIEDGVDSVHYKDASIDAEHLAADAVITAKILNANVTTAKIADDAVTADKLAANAVVNASVAAGAAITFAKLEPLDSTKMLVGNGSNVATEVAISGDVTMANTGAVTIANDAVTGAKLADDIDIAGTLDVTGVTTLDDNLVVATAKTLLARRLPVVALTASTTLSEAVHAGNYVFVTGSSIVITIPDNQGAGVHFTIINNDGNGFTLRTGTNSSSGDLMNGVDDDIAVAARNGVTCISTGTDYVVLGV